MWPAENIMQLMLPAVLCRFPPLLYINKDITNEKVFTIGGKRQYDAPHNYKVSIRSSYNYNSKYRKRAYGPVSAVVKDNAISMESGLGFDTWAGQIGCRIANDLPMLPRFFGAVMPRRLAPQMKPAR